MTRLTAKVQDIQFGSAITEKLTRRYQSGREISPLYIPSRLEMNAHSNAMSEAERSGYNASRPATFLEAAAELRAALVTFVCPLMWPAAQMLAALTRRPLTRDQYESDIAAGYDCRRIGPGQFAPQPLPDEARLIESQKGDQ